MASSETGNLEPPASKLSKPSLELSSLQSLEGFQFTKTLSNSPEYKFIAVLATYAGQNAVVLLDKKPFAEEIVTGLFSKETKCQLITVNDIYGSYDIVAGSKEAGLIKATLIYPATKKHIDKYSFSPFHIVEETPELYRAVVLPHLQSSSFGIDWVYNFLSHKKEADRIVFEDPDPEKGFILAPDLKWDGIQLDNLYLSAVVHSMNIKSLRELNASHLPLLENILTNGSKAIVDKYGLPKSQLRIYIHYQPSYYHLHVHFTSLQFNAPGISIERSHLLQTVISNIRLVGDYYQRVTISFTVKENSDLYKVLLEHGYKF